MLYNMELKKILNQEAALITQQPISHEIEGVEVIIKPLTVKQLMLINPYLTKIAADDLSTMQEMIETADYAKIPELIDNYLGEIKSIIEVVTGETFEDTATIQDYFILLFLILSRSGQLYFQKSIILTAEMSQSDRTEIIAAQKFLTSLN